MSDSNREATFGHAVRRLDELGLAYLHLLDPVRESPFDNPGLARLAPGLRPLFRGPVIVNGAFDRERAIDAVKQREADAVAFGIPFIANPDLAKRLRLGSPLAEPDRSTFYSGEERGYTDYPAL
jgi:N-ethylmaleimide reductase